jgi:DnaJ-class molecular chaperone
MTDHRDNSLTDWYSQLDVRPEASHAEIDAAYRRLARALHPDSASPDSVDVERFQRVLEAHAILSNPARRRDYDERRQPRRPSPASEQQRCPVCRGAQAIMTPCVACHATGYRRSASPWLSTPRPCPVCLGTRRQRLRCGACAGTGYTTLRRGTTPADE